MRCSEVCLLGSVDWTLQLNSTEEKIKCFLAEQSGAGMSVWAQSRCLRWCNPLLQNKFLFSPLKGSVFPVPKRNDHPAWDRQSQPGCIKGRCDLRRSRKCGYPSCWRKFPRAIHCSGVWTAMLLLFLFSEYFALLAGGMVPRYQPCICVLVAFSVNYWQSTNSYEAVFSYGCILFSLLGLTVQPVGLLGKKRGSEKLLYQRDAFLGSSVHGWAQNRLRL